MGRISQPRAAQVLKAGLPDTKRSNPGLVFDRWLPVWDGDAWKKEQGLGALRDFARVHGACEASREALRQHHARLATFLGATPDRAGWSGELVLKTPLCLGLGASHPSENGFTFDPTLGVPWIPGSSLKGAARRWAELDGWSSARIEELFGPPNEGAGPSEEAGQGAVVFVGAWPLEGQPLLDLEIVNCHLPDWYAWSWQQKKERARGKRGEVENKEGNARWPILDENPVPVFLLSVPEGVRFRFYLRASGSAGHADPRRERENMDAAVTLLRGALYWLGVGARSAVGFGTFDLGGKPPEPSRGPGLAVLWLDVDMTSEPDASIKQIYPDTEYTVFRYAGPRSERSGGMVTRRPDWRVMEEELQQLLERVFRMDRAPKLLLGGYMSIPLAFAAGFRLGRWQNVQAIGTIRDQGDYLVDPRVGDERWLKDPEYNNDGSPEPGPVVVHLSWADRRFVGESLDDVLVDESPIGIVQVFGEGALSEKNAKHTQEFLLRLFNDIVARYPRYTKLIYTIDGPWPLALLMGRAINPNLVRAVEVPNFDKGKYSPAFVWPPRN